MSFELLDQLARDGFEEIVALHDRRSGLRAFLAVHDSSAGRAFGGIRRWSYFDEEQALRDCMRLARAMTHKCALARLPAGGAKMVLLDRADLDVPRAYRFLGDVVQRLAGRFYTGPDVGTNASELAHVAERTRFVTDPGPEGPGELAEATASGVVAGIAAALRHLDGQEDWPRRTVVVQGLGEVGSRVAVALREHGARVLASEIDSERARAIAAAADLELLDPTGEVDVPSDVFSPCALGGILHDLSVLRLRCRIVAGAANNVLASAAHGDQLHERGVLYVPDFAINSGALIRGARFHLDGVREPLERIAARVGSTVEQVLRQARDEGLAPARVAEREAELLVERRRSERR
ncbi:MAG: Glu/Leu/Phe/Val dehydrogenase [Planctomycetes bacterium]|nr:Glu/Leu/Phe/Val dehydrogenase [Planctomycetota bacterium]